MSSTAVPLGSLPPVSPAARDPDRAFFGHPKGLAYLAFTEAWERFSFYGMSGLLLLYMIQRLLTPEIMGGVLGLGQFRAAVETLTGPLSNQAFASQVFGLYSGLVYFTPVFGGLLADRLLGQRRTVMLGALMMAAGHIMMAFDALFLAALLLLILGSGCLKGNISVQVGYLYRPEDEGRRTRAFAIFSAAINAGALFGPLVCGILAFAYGWHVGFGAAGLLMLIALATYVAGWNHLPPDRRRRGGPRPAPLTGSEWRVVAALVLVSAIAILPAAVYNQQFTVGILFIEASVERFMFGWPMPSASFNALDGFFCILVVPPLIALWRWQAKRGREPGDIGKIAIAYLVFAAANLLMIVPASFADAGAKVGLIWPLASFLLNAIAFIYYWPTLLALFSRAAPAQVSATMMGVLFASTFVGNTLSGTLAGLWEGMSHARFFALHAGLAIGPMLAMLLIARPIARLLAPPGDSTNGRAA